MTGVHSRSFSSKRIKLEVEDVSPTHNDLEGVEPDQDDSENSCSICLHSIADRTVIPKCSHEFCFECLLVWTEQSRRCPLCSQAIGEYLIHSIRSRYDYRKHYLPPLRTSPPPSRPAQTNAVLQTTRQRRRREREWGTRARESDADEADKLERSIAKRRWIYRHDLYAKHVASNTYTKYRPYPTTAQFAASQDLISRTTTFLRRELQIWEGLDVEFLTTLIISLMKSIDIRSESAVKLISEFLDMDAPYTPGERHVNAEHFVHEVYSYVRSPYKNLFVYDTVVQYDIPSHLPQPTDIERSHRWREPYPIRLSNESSADERHRSQKRSRSRSSERLSSLSPGRKYSPRRKTGISGNRRAPMSTENSQSRPSYDDKHPRKDRDCELTGRQNNLGDASQTPVASSSSNKRGKETPISSGNLSMVRDVKGKRKADEIEMITPLIDGANSEIVESNLVELPVATENNNEPEVRTQDITPIRIVRVPRNRTPLDSVKAHLAISGESARQGRVPSLLTRLSDPHVLPVKAHLAIFGEGARQDPVPSLLTRLSNPHILPVNPTKTRHMLGDCQQNAGDNDHLRYSRKTERQQSLQPSSSRSQDSKTENKLPASSKNRIFSVSNVINRSPPISMSAARPIVRQNSVATSTTVEDNTMAIPSYQRILSRSLPVPSNSQNQVDNDNLPNQVHDQQIPHVQPPSSIGVVGLNFPNQFRPLAHSITLNSEETRTKLLARLEIEKQVVQLSATDNYYSPQPLDDIPSCSSSFAISRESHPIDCDPPLKPHERGPGVLDLASDSLVSDESRKRESKLRARAQLRVRLAAEKRLSG